MLRPRCSFRGKLFPLQHRPLSHSPPLCLAEASGGTEAASGAYDPTMLGDPPPDVPTAELDLDAISSFGSPEITVTLVPFTGLPSNDDPAQGLPFQINFQVPSFGDYSATFLLYYSDEQDLPGADLPGSELASFNVNIDVTPTAAYWTITTDTVPEPSGMALTALAICTLIHFARRLQAV